MIYEFCITKNRFRFFPISFIQYGNYPKLGQFILIHCNANYVQFVSFTLSNSSIDGIEKSVAINLQAFKINQESMCVSLFHTYTWRIHFVGHKLC